MLLSLAVGLFSTQTACVPYVKYQEAVGKLDRANTLYRDMDRKFRDVQAQLGQDAGEGRLANANYDSLKDKYDAALKEIEALHNHNQLLQSQIGGLQDLPLPRGFDAEDAVNTGIELSREGALVLKNDLLFDPGRSVIKSGPKKELDALAHTIKSKYSSRIVSIDGHTDNTPIKKSRNADNWELGSKRAHAVFQYLVKKGVKATQMHLRSFGYARPPEGVGDPNSSKGRTRARRVEIRLGSVL